MQKMSKEDQEPSGETITFSAGGGSHVPRPITFKSHNKTILDKKCFISEDLNYM